jgi:hypothetical protein
MTRHTPTRFVDVVVDLLPVLPGPTAVYHLIMNSKAHCGPEENKNCYETHIESHKKEIRGILNPYKTGSPII